MLLNVHVKNLALIEDVDVYFGDGLNILTGETGAGKSIIIGSINIALGGKVPKDIIRKNAEYGFVELIFAVSDLVKEKLKEKGIFIEEENQVVISRKNNQWQKYYKNKWRNCCQHTFKRGCRLAFRCSRTA